MDIVVLSFSVTTKYKIMNVCEKHMKHDFQRFVRLGLTRFKTNFCLIELNGQSHYKNMK